MLLNIIVKLIRYTEDAPRLVAVASKASLSRKPLQELLEISDDEVEVWIKETFRRQHFSPWEHASYTFVIDGLSRVASHQLVRHRYASYTQMSHRYTEGYLRSLALRASEISGVNCPEKPEGNKREVYKCYAYAILTASSILEESIEKVELASIAFVPPPTFLSKEDLLIRWADLVLETAYEYYKLLSQGALKEDARYVLADSVRTRIVVTMNARELVQVFLPLRMCTRAQWEMRHIAWAMWRELVKVHPQLFKWAGPSCVYRENTTRKEPAELEKFLEGEEKFTIPRCPELVDNKAIPKCLKVARL
ncbi:MAG: FAD-dependent thymidylate synthase [Thermosphaera sp.]|nr:FAD-dependent thymidylate synthase [Thermosphaera sp.]